MILQIIGFTALTHLVVDFINHLDVDNRLDNKPWKCDMCMGYWISLFPLTIQYGLQGILAASVVGVLSDVLFRIKTKL